MGCYYWFMAMPSATRFFIPFLGSGLAGVVCLVAFNIRFCFAHDGNGVPKLPTLLPEDELEICVPFGASNLDEAADILGIDKAALLKRLADPDPCNYKALMGMVNLEKVAEAFDKKDADGFVRMLEATPEIEEEDETNAEDVERTLVANGSDASPTGCDPLLPLEAEGLGSVRENELTPSSKGDKEQCAAVDNIGSGMLQTSETPGFKTLGRELRQLFLTPGSDPNMRAAMLIGDKMETNHSLRVRALAKCLCILVQEGDAEGIKLFMLEVPLEDNWNALVGMEEWLDKETQKDFDKQFNRLVPAKQWAVMLKQNPKLKELISRFMKREVQKSVGKFRRK